MSQIKIGWASRDVSTDKPINIPGQFHMRISKGVSDPVTVTALVLDGGDDQAIFLSADLVVIRSGLLDEIREKTKAANPAIPAEKILMNATHAHTGPSHYKDAGWNRNLQATGTGDPEMPYNGLEVASSDEYRHFLSGEAASAICEAWDKRAEGGIAYGYGYAVVAHSRRVVYFDDVSKRPGAINNSTHGVNGHAVMYGNTNDPMFSHYEAGADHFINLLYTFDGAGELTGAIVNVPCPSQNSEHEWNLTADYWHDTRCAIRKKHGNIFILPQCAAAGDLSPRILHYKKAQERRFALKYGDVKWPEGMDAHGIAERAARKDIAERISCAFDEVLSWAGKDIKKDLKVAHTVDTVDLTRRYITDEEYEHAKAGLAEEMKNEFVNTGDPTKDIVTNSMIVAGRNRYRQIINRYELQKKQPKLPMELHVIRVGDIAFASNRFELYMDYQHRIQARSPFEQTFIVQLSGQPGDEGGSYLCTERGEQGRGYSASMYCNQASPVGGQELVEATLKRLEELKG